MKSFGIVGGAVERPQRQWFGFEDWKKKQHYKHRRPPWIKSAVERLDDYAFSQLSDVAKGHLFGLELLASKRDNVLPADPTWLGRQISATEAIDLGALGAFIIVVEAETEAIASRLLARRTRAAIVEEEGEGEGHEEEEQFNVRTRYEYSASFEEFWELYPVNRDKRKAHFAFDVALKGLGGGEEAYAFLMAKLRQHVTRWETNADEWTRIPHPTKWLSDARWEDEFPEN